MIKITAADLFCPSCNSPNGFCYTWPEAECKDCKNKSEIFDLFLKALNQTHDSDLWSFSFRILSTFKVAPVHEGLSSINYKPLQTFEVDLNKMGLPANSRILFLNFTPDSQVIPVNIWQSKRSTDDIEHKLQMFGMPLGLPTKKYGESSYGADTSSVDASKFLTASLLIRWCKKGTTLSEQHIIKAAENYNTDVPLMVYNSFTAFELMLSNLIEKFWIIKKSLTDKEYKNLFERINVYKQIEEHLPLICRELDIELDDRKKMLLHNLRNHRNSVVHSGNLKTNLKADKNELYGIACWGIILLQELEKRLN